MIMRRIDDILEELHKAEVEYLTLKEKQEHMRKTVLQIPTWEDKVDLIKLECKVNHLKRVYQVELARVVNK